MRKYLNYTVLIFAYSCSLSQNYNEFYQKLENDYELMYVGDKNFITDSLLLAGQPSFFFDGGDNSYLTFYSNLSKSLLFFNYNKEILVKEIRIKDNNKIISSVRGYYIHNCDSIFILESNLQMLFLVNSQGDIINFYDMKWNNTLVSHPPAPTLGINRPLLIKNNKIFLAGYTGGEFKDEEIGNRPVGIEYSIQEKHIVYFADFPKLYYKYNWAGLGYRWVYNTFDPTNSKIVYSFPVSHKIFVYDLNSKDCNEYSACSNHIEFIKPFQKGKDWFGVYAKEDYDIYFYTNPSYGSIYFDKFRNLYYRFAEFPREDFNNIDLETYMKPISIVVMDKNFNYIGEKIIDGIKLISSRAFVSETGLNIEVYNKRENKIKYEIYYPRLIK